MERTYKVTHKVYYNDRLNKVLIHGKPTYPLYIQVTFDRKSIVFKSYYFDLFSKAKYSITLAGHKYAPDIEEIIKKEDTFIEFIIDKNPENFSLELFKKEYTFYCRDLLDMLEDGFLDYLYTFFHDEGLPYLAEIIKVGSKNFKMFDLIYDLKTALNPKLYDKLLENSSYYAPPYLPLYSFSESPKKTALRIFTVMEWEQPGIKEKFAEYLVKQYSKIDVSKTLKEIKKGIGSANGK